MSHTHQQLCDIGVRWLKRHSNGMGCQFAISEMQTGFHRAEQVDVFGYKCSGKKPGSYLVEVKTSRADFAADFKKPHRIDPWRGVGQYRIYLCPEKVIDIEDLPPFWGLAYVNSRGHIKMIEEPTYKVANYNYEGELYMMARLISRFDDVEKLNKSMKEQSRLASAAWREVEKLREENRNWRDRFHELKHRMDSLEH